MNTQILIDAANQLVADHKGLLAMDESDPTCNKRFAKLGIPQTADARRAYRELIVTAPGLGESISGSIFFDETCLRAQRKSFSKPENIFGFGIFPHTFLSLMLFHTGIYMRKNSIFEGQFACTYS